MAAPHCLNRAALTRDGGGWRRVGGGGGDGEEGVGKLPPRRRTDSQGAAGARRCLSVPTFFQEFTCDAV